MPPPRDLGSLDEKLWHKKYSESDLKPLKEEEWRHRDDFKGGTVLIVVVIVLFVYVSRERQGRPKAIGSGVSGVFIWGVGGVYLGCRACLFGFSFLLQEFICYWFSGIGRPR